MGAEPASQKRRGLDISRVPRWARIAARIVFLHSFVYFGVSIYIGGDSVGILPSEDGFVVKDHGVETQVTEGVFLADRDRRG